MNNTTNKRYYTPQFSQKAAVTVRRLAWALCAPMTKTIDIIINEISLIFDPAVICPKCQDKTKCGTCGFNPQNQGAAK